MNDPLADGSDTSAPPSADDIEENPELLKRHANFGLEDRSCDIEERDFNFGETVRIAGKTVVLDKERRDEGMTDIEINPSTGQPNPNYVPLADRIVLEADVTGLRGTVLNGAYYDPKIDDDRVPVELNRGQALVYVPSKRLERYAGRKNGKVAVAVDRQLTPDEERLLVEYRKRKAEEDRKFLESLDTKS